MIIVSKHFQYESNNIDLVLQESCLNNKEMVNIWSKACPIKLCNFKVQSTNTSTLSVSSTGLFQFRQDEINRALRQDESMVCCFSLNSTIRQASPHLKILVSFH